METSIGSLWLLLCLFEILIIINLAIRDGKTWHVFGCSMLLLTFGVIGFFECLGMEMITHECAVITTGMLAFALFCLACCYVVDRVNKGKDDDEY